MAVIIMWSIVLLFAIVFFNLITSNGIQSMQQDLNVLKNNDIAFADYIKTNSTTLEYLNNNCKITQDNNETTTLICIKVK